MAKNYLAFDLGASSGRGIIGTIDNGKLSLREIHRFSNGVMERDGSLYWDYPTLCAEIKTGLGKALKIQPDISSIAIDTWGVDYVLFDRDSGEPKRLPYHYRDSRTETIPEEVFKIISKDELYSRTGIQFMPLNTLYQLVAHQKEHPEDFKNSIMLPIPDALTYFLNGAMDGEYTEASTSNLLDPAKREWDFALIDKLGLPRDIFPELVKPCTLSRPLKQELCDEFDCNPIPVVKVGAHDTASAVAAVPAPVDRSWAYVSCGTWALLGAEIDQPICSAEAGAVPVTNEGGLENSIRFLTNIMGTWLLQETRRVWNEGGKDTSFQKMEEMARAAAPCKSLINPNAEIFFTPGDMPARVKEFCKQTAQEVPASDGAALRAIYDSLALCFKAKLAGMASILDTEYQCLNIVGGGTKDRLLMQLTADALGVPVVAGPVEATAIGNIVAQAIAHGDIASVAAAREVIKASFELDTYTPAGEDRACWDAAFDKFSQIAE